MTTPEGTQPTGRYAQINGLNMYYETYGPDAGVPLVLLHGALSATETSFGRLVAGLSDRRRVIAVEQQGHGRTADVDRPIRMAQMAEDTIALLEYLDIPRADLYGYSMGAGIAVEVAVRRPDLVHKLVLASVSINGGGFHPGVLDGIDMMTAEAMAGSPFEAEYLRLAPRPQDWPALIAKVQDMDRNLPDMPADVFGRITAPTLLVFGDSDIIRPEHAVELFRLLGGGVAGDMTGLPASRLAILPGTTHVTVPDQAGVLVPMIRSFLG
jgi:pimeloyl-ACP methyl ester carboxylesterase